MTSETDTGKGTPGGSSVDGDQEIPADAIIAALNAAAPAERSEEDAEESFRGALVVIRVGDRWLAVRANTVREVVIKGFVTRLPLAPSHLLGLTLVHGRLVPVVSLEGLIPGINPAPSGQMLPRLVVVAHGDSEVALVTDEAQGVVEVDIDVDGVVGNLAGINVAAEIDWRGEMLAVLDTETLVARALER